MLSWLRDSPDVYTLLAKRSYGKARRLLEQQLRKEPSSVHLRQLYADVLERQGETGEAVKILGGLAEDLADDGFTAKAIAVLKKIERVDPESSELAERLASRLRQQAEQAPEGPAPIFRSPNDEEEGVLEALGESSEPAMATSELVDNWLEVAQARTDFHLSPLFRGVSVDELAILIGGLDLLVKNPGAIIFSLDEPGTSFFVLASGYARVYRRTPEMRHEQVAMLREGEIFGAGAMLGEHKRLFTVIAATTCELLELDRQTFDTLAIAHPHLHEMVQDIDCRHVAAWTGGAPQL